MLNTYTKFNVKSKIKILNIHFKQINITRYESNRHEQN